MFCLRFSTCAVCHVLRKWIQSAPTLLNRRPCETAAAAAQPRDASWASRSRESARTSKNRRMGVSGSFHCHVRWKFECQRSCSEQEQQAGRSARHCCCLQRPFPRLLDPYRAGSSTRDPRVVILLQSGGPSEYAFGVQETRARVRRMAAEVLTSTEWSASLALQQISHRVRFTVHSHDRATLFGTLASRSSHCLRKSCPGRALSAVRRTCT